MLGDAVEVTIQKVDVLRHQIDLAVVLPEGYEEYVPDGDNDSHHDQESSGDAGEE
jgi:ribonuclease R